jgi:hypothetical protein
MVRPEISILQFIYYFYCFRYFLFLVPEPIRKNIVYKKNKNKNNENDRSTKAQQSAYYKPSMYADEIGLTSDKYIPLNSTVDSLPLKISFEPMSLQVFIIKILLFLII